ncbi:MAG: glycerophosphoryl diester phosphodiesterase membrane domain-containing protein [Turicibacter sp.]|nr:glycerophosphoryl diester phosphodiesterase membrane domain-containing protein [Turicibacter sp.]
MQSDLLPMNAATLMDRVFDVYKATFKFQMAFSIVVNIISILFVFTLGIVFAMAIGVVANLLVFSDDFMVFVVLAVLVMILPLYLIWTYFATSGHILISKYAFFNEPVNLPMHDAFAALFRVIGATFAQIILSLPWLLIAGGAAYYLFLSLEYGLIYNAPTALIVILVLAFVVSYLVYSNIFALLIPVAIFDKCTFFSAVARSYQLIKENFWRILGLRLLWFVLAFILSYSAQGLALLLLAATTDFAGENLSVLYFFLASGTLQLYVSLFVGLLIQPIDGILTALIYFNQRIKKEGFDIFVALMRLKRKDTGIVQ